MSQINRIIKFTLIFTSLIICFANCSPPKEKSELVRRLESIFNDPSFVNISKGEFNVGDYGAKGDGETLNTEAIQQAINDASEAGGGRVIFPEGIYLSGALFIRSNVELYIDEDVTIKAIQDDDAFPDIWTRIAGIEMEWPAALINVNNAENVRISGRGTIDGNGKYWWDKFWGDPPRSGGMFVEYKKRDLRWALDYDCKRVRALLVYKSKDVALEDFRIERSGFWAVTLTYSQRVHVDGIVIRNNIGGKGPSSDGINTDSSIDILVENCDVDCNDDNFAIKAGRGADGLRVNKPVENVVYRNNRSRSGHGLFTIGSETAGGMRNIEVYGLEAEDTQYGIRFKSAKVRGGVIENIRFHDIKMNGVPYPFYFELNWFPSYSYPEIPEEIPEEEIPVHWEKLTERVKPKERGIPEFRDLVFEDITVKNAKQAFYANAYPEKPIHNLHWENIAIQSWEAGELTYAENWTMKNVTMQTKNCEQLALKNCRDIQLPSVISAEEEKN